MEHNGRVHYMFVVSMCSGQWSGQGALTQYNRLEEFKIQSVNTLCILGDNDNFTNIIS